MPVINDKYDQFKIDKLKHYLEDMASKGQPRSYEIFVDSLKVVPRTEEVKEFDSHEYYMNENTEKVRILIYAYGQSPRNDQYCFYVQQNKTDKPLSGMDELDGIIQEKLAVRDREHEMNRLRTELSETKVQLEEAEEYSEQLQEEIEELKKNKFKLGSINLGELASVALESMVRRNPQFLSKLPGGEMLAGVIEQDTLEKKQANGRNSTESSASFQPKQSGTPDDTEYTQLLRKLEQTFNQEEFQLVMQVLGKFNQDPSHLLTVAELLNIQTT